MMKELSSTASLSIQNRVNRLTEKTRKVLVSEEWRASKKFSDLLSEAMV
jgi:hypothetical protein